MLGVYITGVYTPVNISLRWQQLTTNMAIGNNKNRKELTSSLKSLLYAAIWDIFGQVCLHEFIKTAHKG